MSMNDPIADMLTRIRNAQLVRHTTVAMASSKMKVAIAQVLKEEGYIQDYEASAAAEEGKSTLTVTLKYFNDRPVIDRLERVSRPGLRRYSAATEMPVVMDHLGIAIVTTSKGVMTGQAASAAGLGGEVLCFVA